MSEVTEAVENQEVEAIENNEIAETQEIEEKLLKQSEVDEIVQSRLARERRKFDKELQRQIKFAQEAQSFERPVQEEGESIADYNERFFEWKESQKKAEKYRETLKQRDEESEDDLNERIAEFYEEAEKIPEFDKERFAKSVKKANLSDAFVEALMDLPIKDRAKVGAYLDANRTEFKTLGEMSSMAQVRYLGKLETKLEKLTSKTSPMTKISGAGMGNDQSNPAKLKAGSPEYVEWRRKQGSRLFG